MEIRSCVDKERAMKLKTYLPCVCFSGKFGGSRQNSDLIDHSGYIILDFDSLSDPEREREEMMQYEYAKAAWISPSGKGVKVLVHVADGSKHREHFAALRDIFPNIDKSGVNEARLCYESYDPGMIVRNLTTPFREYKTTEVFKDKVNKPVDIGTFTNILKWLSNKGDAFRTGERNLFIYKLASACCRFGMDEWDCQNNIYSSVLNSSGDFTQSEAERTIRSAYKSNSALAGTAHFDREVLVTKTTKAEVEIDEKAYELDNKLRDVIYGEDVKNEALSIYDNGYESASTTYVDEIDVIWKWKKKEVTLLSGIGNYGKGQILKFLILLKTINEGLKWALFVPEDCPAEEVYHEFCEMYAGHNLTPANPFRVSRNDYESIYDFIKSHIFIVYPKELSPTPIFIKEKFLELIIKEGVTGCVVDPFNQMANDYTSAGGRDDKYLEVVLSDFSKFSKDNDIYFIVVAHPKAMRKGEDGNYPEPDVFDLAGGAMWSNKMDNILIYHRPVRNTEPESALCTLSSKKIKRQKIVGMIGTVQFSLDRRSRRFFFGKGDIMANCISNVSNQQSKEVKDDLPF